MTIHTPIKRPLAHLSSFVNIDWTDHAGREHECQCEVEYTFDGGDELTIKTVHVVYGIGSDSYDFDELVYDAVSEVAPEAYAEWQCEYDDEMIARAADAHWLGQAA